MAFSEKLREAMNRRGLKAADLSRETGLSEAIISEYLSGKKEPRGKQSALLSKTLDVSLDELWETPFSGLANTEPYRPKRKIPLLGKIRAGQPILATEQIEGYISVDFDDNHEYFALRVVGDSMNAVRINEGDVLIVRQQSSVENGEIAVVLVNGDDATVKRFMQSGNMVTLIPMSNNSEYMPQVYDADKTPVKVLGKVVRVTFDL